MVSDDKLKEIIAQVVGEMMKDAPVAAKAPKSCSHCDDVKDDDLEDLTAYDLSTWYQVKNAHNEAEYIRLKSFTPARLGVGHTGPRLLTNTMLRFRADHAAAQDAVFNEFPEEFCREHGLLELKTRCDSKDTFLTRPDLGRRLDEESAQRLKEFCKKPPKVQVYASDGLSGTAIEANYDVVMPAIMQGLKSFGIEAGEPFFVRYGRVGAMDEVTEITGCEVCVTLIGERPGLVTAESMSAYLTYKGSIGMSESKRTVVSNIHNAGTPAAEAGAHIADIINEMLKQKASGLDLKL